MEREKPTEKEREGGDLIKLGSCLCFDYEFLLQKFSTIRSEHSRATMKAGEGFWRESLGGTKGAAPAGCNNSCGCPSPCPGGPSCSCTASGGEGTHMKCPCGDHCGCNPCTCTKTEVRGVGKAFCKCGSGCTCATCQA